MKQTWTKAVAAFVLTFLAALGTALQSGTITVKESLIALGSALVVGVGTWSATNKQTFTLDLDSGKRPSTSDLDAEAEAYKRGEV